MSTIGTIKHQQELLHKTHEYVLCFADNIEDPEIRVEFLENLQKAIEQKIQTIDLSTKTQSGDDFTKPPLGALQRVLGRLKIVRG